MKQSLCLAGLSAIVFFASGSTSADPWACSARPVPTLTKGRFIWLDNDRPDKKYGLGFNVNSDGDGAFGHGGAAGTNMTVYPRKRLALVWLVQVCGGFPGKGGEAQGAFNAAAFAMQSEKAVR